MEFVDAWLWLVFVIIGVVLAALELAIGVDAGLDLVILGSAFLIGGFLSWIFDSWELALIATGVLCVAYIGVGRRYVHRLTAVAKEKTNVDAIIGARGVVVAKISRVGDGLVKVGHEEWRAKADEDIDPGQEIVVKSVRGVTLSVEKSGR